MSEVEYVKMGDRSFQVNFDLGSKEETEECAGCNRHIKIYPTTFDVAHVVDEATNEQLRPGSLRDDVIHAARANYFIRGGSLSEGALLCASCGGSD